MIFVLLDFKMSADNKKRQEAVKKTTNLKQSSSILGNELVFWIG